MFMLKARRAAGWEPLEPGTAGRGLRGGVSAGNRHPEERHERETQLGMHRSLPTRRDGL